MAEKELATFRERWKQELSYKKEEQRLGCAPSTSVVDAPLQSSQTEDQPEYVSIARGLLDGRTSPLLDRIQEERTRRKRLYHNMTDACSASLQQQKQPKGRREEELVEQLIEDLNEVNDIPFFDVELPYELALKIFQYLTCAELGRCAQVSFWWKIGMMEDTNFHSFAQTDTKRRLIRWLLFIYTFSPTDKKPIKKAESHTKIPEFSIIHKPRCVVFFLFSTFLRRLKALCGSVPQIHVYSLETSKPAVCVGGSPGDFTCINLRDAPPHLLVCGNKDRRVRVFDLRAGSSVLSLYAHHLGVTSVQADDWKVVSGGGEGLVCVWEMRMGAKLWEMHNRHPVRHVRFSSSTLLTANIPDDKSPRGACITDDDLTAHRRHRGVICHYDFSEDALSPDHVLPICRSDYVDSYGYNYNIGLAVPYDRLSGSHPAL
uniref:F-box and WD repeat domain containing 8 n=1 Tax=Oryzias sinensis TaxID=183150 RepID=A0A8C7ZJL8_9TELE